MTAARPRPPTLAGKVAVVTGASRGLGAATAEALAAAGATVLLLARSERDVAAVAERIGPTARWYRCDVADPRSVASVFGEIAARHDRLHLLVNNAGAAGPHVLEELSEANLERELAVNLAGPLRCMRAALPLLRAAGHSDVINISTIAVKNPYPAMWLYSAAKAGLEHASAALAEELAPAGVRVTVLRVGSIAGSSFQDEWDAERKARALATARDAGRERFAGAEPVAAELLSEWIVQLASLPPGARVGTMDLRPA